MFVSVNGRNNEAWAYIAMSAHVSLFLATKYPWIYGYFYSVGEQ